MPVQHHEALTRRIERFAKAPRAALFVDFDGTISDIVDDPTQSVADPSCLASLSVLARRLHRVCIVSARPVEFLQRHVPDPGVELYGMYGMQFRDVEGVHTVARVSELQHNLDEVGRRIERTNDVGLVVHSNGLSISLHYRHDPALRSRAEEIARLATAGIDRFQVLAGRKVVEIAPEVGVDKGSVVSMLTAHCSAGMYCGDDRSDLDGFRALDERSEDPGFTAIRIAVSSDELPPDLRDAADLVVDGVSGMAAFLQRLQSD